MSDKYDLNALVEQGKKDIMEMVGGDVFRHVLTHANEKTAAALSARFRLALGDFHEARIDIERAREIIIGGNSEILGRFLDDGVSVLAVMERVAGRIAALQACGRALDNMLATMDGNMSVASYMKEFKEFLAGLEKNSTKIFRNDLGEPQLLQREELFEASLSAAA